ncbi:MAG: OadG family protein [Bacillota bacterium]
MGDINFALQVMVLGFSVVVVTLVGLYFILLIFTRIFNKKDRPVKKNESHQTETVVTDKPDEDDRKAAAIFAAVYRYLQIKGDIKKDSRISIAVQSADLKSSGGWHIIGRKALMEKRMELERIRRMKQRENIQGNS